MRYIDEVSKLEDTYLTEIEQALQDGPLELSLPMKRLRKDFALLQSELIKLDLLAEKVYRQFKV